MTESARGEYGTPGRLAALLTEAVAEAISAAGGHSGGVYLRSSTPGILRLGVLAGLPRHLFRPWWRVHVDRPYPVADTYRLGSQVVLPNGTETMRRYPQLAAGLPYPFGSIHVPVTDAGTTFGVLTVLRPAAPDVTDVLLERDRTVQVAERLGAALHRLESDGPPVAWDDEPLCVRPPAKGGSAARVACFSWEPATGALTSDAALPALLGLPPGKTITHVDALADAVAPDVQNLLLQTARGKPPPLPVHLRAADGRRRLMQLWGPRASPGSSSGTPPVSGIVLDPDPGAAADAVADLLPDGVFCLDRLGTIVYVNPQAVQVLRRPRSELLGRALWDGVPWLNQPACEEYLRAALLAPTPVHFHVRRPSPTPQPESAGRSPEGDWLAVSVYPGPDILACTVHPSGHVSDNITSAPSAHDSGAARPEDALTAPLYRPIALAIALTEAVTARQVSAVVMQELLPAFGGRRLAIYLLQERHLYLAWETGFPEGFLGPFEGVGLDAHLPGVETLTTGLPLFFDSMRDLHAAYPDIPLDATEGARAFLPLIASGRPVGSCILGFDRTRSFSPRERSVLTALAGLIAHAMEKAQRYDTEAALARGLQQALLPRRLSAHPRVETAGRYLPGTQGMDVGGDWYDVVESGNGLALVIGDVQGHGVQAAATMGQLRSAVRAFAVGDHPPDEVMRGTNHLLIDLDPGQFASCCYVRLDPVTGLARAARAGHPPPLLRDPDGHTHVVDIRGGVVLGVDPQAHYPVTELRLEPGAILALYTDGLVERPGSDIDDGITALRGALAKVGADEDHAGGRSLAGVADRLTATARHTADRPDDIALLLATRRSGTGRGAEE